MVDSKRLSLAAIVVSLAALTAAMWVLLREPEPRRASNARPSNDAKAGEGASTDRGGVARRSASDASLILAGQVLDQEGAPVQEGTVTFECASTGRPLRGTSRLDEDGRFDGMGCPGEVCVQLHHPSLMPAEAWVIEAGQEAELIARRRPALAGRVTHAGEPVAGARIAISQTEEDPTAMPAFAQHSATTDADGRFVLPRVELPPCDPCAVARGQCEAGQPRRDVVYRGALSMSAMARGFTTGVVGFDEVPEHPIELELKRPTLLTRGTLVGADEQFFPRADLVFRSDERARESHRVRVHEGSFELAELASGTYSLRVLQDGVELLALPGVEAGAELNLRSELDAAGAELLVRVTDPEGRPLSDIRIDGGPFPRGSATDAQGQLRVPSVVAGRYRARLWVQGGTPKQVSFELEAGVIREAKASISGQIEQVFTYEAPQSARP